MSAHERFTRHRAALEAAKNDPDKLKPVLEAIKKDRHLTDQQREGLMRVLAQMAAVVYLEITTGKKVPRPS